MICWKENTEQPDRVTRIYVYNEDGEEVFKSGWQVSQGAQPWQNDHDFVNNRVMELSSGKYYFVLQAEGDAETCRSSEKAVSPVWEYTQPEVQQEMPTGPQWNEFPNNQWDPATEEHVAGYTVVYSTRGCNLRLHFSFQPTVSCQILKNPLC